MSDTDTPREMVAQYRLTLDDLRTIQEVMTGLADHHRRIGQRLERSQQLTDTGRTAALHRNREAVTRYERIAARAGREVLELDGEL